MFFPTNLNNILTRLSQPAKKELTVEIDQKSEEVKKSKEEYQEKFEPKIAKRPITLQVFV